MSSIKENNRQKIKGDFSKKRIAIARSEYNGEITGALLKSCVAALCEHGVKASNIKTFEVPGAFELPYVCQKISKTKKFHAIITIGAIIRGETPHFDFIALGAVKGIMDVSLKFDVPIVFGVLTVNNIKQARDRIKNGRRGDKGVEAAKTALKLLKL
jgi:6,7-dimethyl-8-ribityllumazine synthase